MPTYCHKTYLLFHDKSPVTQKLSSDRPHKTNNIAYTYVFLTRIGAALHFGGFDPLFNLYMKMVHLLETSLSSLFGSKVYDL